MTEITRITVETVAMYVARLKLWEDNMVKFNLPSAEWHRVWDQCPLEKDAYFSLSDRDEKSQSSIRIHWTDLDNLSPSRFLEQVQNMWQSIERCPVLYYILTPPIIEKRIMYCPEKMSKEDMWMLASQLRHVGEINNQKKSLQMLMGGHHVPSSYIHTGFIPLYDACCGREYATAHEWLSMMLGHTLVPRSNATCMLNTIQSEDKQHIFSSCVLNELMTVLNAAVFCNLEIVVYHPDAVRECFLKKSLI